jgi:hypothetical protein
VAKKAKPPLKVRQVYGMRIAPKKKGKRAPSQIYPKEFTRLEIAAIGVMTIQWSYLEHMLLLATAELVDKAKIQMPAEATSISFERRLEAFREVVKQTQPVGWKRTQLLSLATRISNIQNDRHMVTHGLWDWYPSRPTKLRLYSFRPQFAFETNFDLPRLAAVCERLGEINYELSYPPSKGLKKRTIHPNDMAYISRETLIEWTDPDPAKFGITPPSPLPEKIKAKLAELAKKKY